VRRDPLRDHVVSVAALHLQLHRLSAPDRQCFALNMPVKSGDFRILQGEPNGWHHTSPNGTPVISRFCGHCGTRLYGERDGRPETISLRAGTLDDTSWLAPVAHFFMRSAQPWVQPAPGAACFETQPNGWGSLLPGWRARWIDPAD